MKRRSLVPWLVALAFFGPFVGAVLLYYLPADLAWLPRLPGSRELFEPPLAVPPSWLDAEPDAALGRYRWSLIYAKMTACDQPCLASLERLRQVQAALGADVDRVRRVYWYAGDAPSLPTDRELALRRVDDSESVAVARSLGPDRLRLGRVYVADPQGFLVASYPADVAQKELLRDLKRVLAVSGSN